MGPTSPPSPLHYGEVEKRGQKLSTLTIHFSVDFGPKFTKFGTELPQLPKNPNKHKYLKQIFYKLGKNPKKPVGGVYASQDWSLKKALAKRICFYKRHILRKHPQIAN